MVFGTLNTQNKVFIPGYKILNVYFHVLVNNDYQDEYEHVVFKATNQPFVYHCESDEEYNQKDPKGVPHALCHHAQEGSKY